MSDLSALQDRLGYRFENEGLLRLALTHPSVVREQNSSVEHNQRLEFLGDAVLQLVLTSVLYSRFPRYGEGPLTKARAFLVNRKSLAEHSGKLGLGEHLILSRGEELNGGRERPSTLADAFEALLGAIFLDTGFESATQFITQRFDFVFDELEALPAMENPKGDLQEILQANLPEPPKYRLISVTGPDHEKNFECAVYHSHGELGRGTGKSKKEAESRAAMDALSKLNSSPGAESISASGETGENTASTS